MTRRYDTPGFTLIEVLVMVTILMILASAAYFFIGGWRERAAITEVKNDLTNASIALENRRNFSNDYPGSLSNAIFAPTATVQLSYTLRGDKTYCLNGSSKVVASVRWNIDSRTGKKLAEGTCTP